MKIKELLSESSSVLLTAAVKVLNQHADTLRDKAQATSSHNIGGNFHAVISGNIKIRNDFDSYDYNTRTEWNTILEIGNNVMGSLELAKNVYEDVLDKLRAISSDVSVIDHDFQNGATVSLGNEKIFARYEYARSFCWVGVRSI